MKELVEPFVRFVRVLQPFDSPRRIAHDHLQMGVAHRVQHLADDGINGIRSGFERGHGIPLPKPMIRRPIRPRKDKSSLAIALRPDDS